MARKKPYCMDFEKLIAKGENPKGMTAHTANKTERVEKEPWSKVREH